MKAFDVFNALFEIDNKNENYQQFFIKIIPKIIEAINWISQSNELFCLIMNQFDFNIHINNIPFLGKNLMAIIFLNLF